MFLLVVLKNWCLTLVPLNYKNMQLYLRLGLKVKKYCVLELKQWLKPHVEFNTQKRIEAEKNGDKDGKVLCKLINNTVYGKTMENLRTAAFLQRFSFFTVCLVHYLYKVLPRWAPKGSFLKLKSPNCWRMHS